MISIIVGGDVYPAGRVQSAFAKGLTYEIFHDLLEDIVTADLSIVNLESPLISKKTPIIKVGPILDSNPQCIEGLSAAKWKVLNLANNHIYDHGANGLRETIQTIEKAGLSFLGAGENIEEARTPLSKEIAGQRVVIYSMAEREFSVARENSPGANPLDIINFVHAIRQHKQTGAFIVLIHGGNEFYPYPSPEMVRRCRFMIEMGADAVVCCHAHCALPWEFYKGRPIIYGLGNLIFEGTGMEPDIWYEGYLAKLTLDDGRIGFEAIPYFQSKAGIGARKMDETSRNFFFNGMQEKGGEIKDSARLEERWLEYCRRQKDLYMSELFGYNRIMRKLRGFLLKTIHSKRSVLQALLMVQCEAHREILTTILNDYRQEE